MPQKLIQKVINSVSLKIFLAITGATLFTACLMSLALHYSLSHMIYNYELKNLQERAHIVQPALEFIIKDFKEDINTLAKLPTLISVAHQQAENEVSEDEKKLQEIFLAVLEENKHYVQVRYIDARDQGWERVRVNRKGDNFELVPKEDLQQKAQESYYKAALNLQKGEVYFSNVSLNIEHGKIEQPLLPVIRAAQPIFGEDGLLGFLVINASYENFLNYTLDIENTRDFYVIKDLGEELSFVRDNTKNDNSKFELFDANENRVLLNKIKEHGGEEGLLIDKQDKEGSIVYFMKYSFGVGAAQRYMVVTFYNLENRYAELLTPALNISLILSLFLIVLAIAIGFVITNIVQKPMQFMLKRIQQYKAGGKIPAMPIDRKDEFGDLAVAFESMAVKLENMRKKEAESAAYLQEILSNTVEGLITIDERGIILSYNPACEKLFGYQVDEVIGRNVSMLMPDKYAHEHDTYLQNYHTTGEKKIIGTGRELSAQKKNGEIFPIELSVSEVKTKGARVFSGIVRDITARKQAEEEIIRSNEELENFAYIASHDLQEPARMVASFTQLLKEELGDDISEDVDEYMKFISSSAARMQMLISDLLDYSRIHNSDSSASNFSAQGQLDYILDTLQATIEKEDAVIEFDQLPVIYYNPLRFSRVLQNLIGNALKYKAADQAPKIEISCKPGNQEWIFCVADNGIGIKQEHLQQIFIIFRRLHNKNSFDGTGIGLAICKKIIESSGGRLWVESEFGKGSKFYFTIPMAESTERAA